MNNIIVATNGCFDLIHIGHVRYLKYAAGLGEQLIVGINDDESVKKLKGNSRPIFNEFERQEILSSFYFVYQVIIFNGITAIEFLKKVKPDIWVKGGDYTMDSLNKEEVNFVKSYGGQIVIAPLIMNKSTSEVLNKIIKG